MFEPGTLWELVTTATTRALVDGALQPIRTRFELVADGGVEFLVRVVANLENKQRQSNMPSSTGTPQNPFLPYDQKLYVADASPSHVCLLNKFNVVDHHLLIVTREFEDQRAPLTLEDFAALWRCMAEYNGLGFYNAGAIAGASQPHKHLQLVPLPLAEHGPAVPIESLMPSADEPGRIGRITALPFDHALVRFEPDPVRSTAAAAAMSLDLYREMMRVVGLATENDAGQVDAAPYNLLVTRRWMLLVPRAREKFHGISLNALAFAGALLVRDDEQLATLKAHGPMAALASTACQTVQRHQ
jgi:ATP adenylyltransferase